MCRFVCLVLGAVFALASPAFANAEFTRVVKEALTSADPTTAILRGLAGMRDFDMDEATVAAALAAAGARPDGPVAQVLGDVTRLRKKDGSITMERRTARTLPIAVAGVTKGWVRLERTSRFSVRADGQGVSLDRFAGVSVGESERGLYDLRALRWKAGVPVSTLSITAGWGPFSKTIEVQVPTPAPDAGLPVPAKRPTPPARPDAPPTGTGPGTSPAAPAAPPAATPGIISRIRGGE